MNLQEDRSVILDWIYAGLVNAFLWGVLIVGAFKLGKLIYAATHLVARGLS